MNMREHFEKAVDGVHKKKRMTAAFENRPLKRKEPVPFTPLLSSSSSHHKLQPFMTQSNLDG
jgi:hypothetical protein